MGIKIKFNKPRWDENIGCLAGIIVVAITGKIWMVPDLSFWEIFRAVVKSYGGW